MGEVPLQVPREILWEGGLSYERGTFVRLEPPEDARAPDTRAERVMHVEHRGTSIIRKSLPLGPCSSRVPRGLGWSSGGEQFRINKVIL